jgi:hypothetical protein
MAAKKNAAGNIEIDENQFAAMQRVVEVAAALEGNPETKFQFFELAKKAKPDLRIPEMEVKAAADAQIGTLHKKIDDFITAQAARDEEAKKQATVDTFTLAWNKQKQFYIDQGAYPDAIAEVEKFAHANGISNFDAAVALWEKQNPPSLKSGRATLFTNFDDKSDDAKFKQELFASAARNHSVNENLVTNHAEKVLQEVRSSNRRYA